MSDLAMPRSSPTFRAAFVGGLLLCAVARAMPGAAAAPDGPARRESAGSPVTIDDLLAVVRLSRPVLSPDGRHAALVVSRPVAAENRRSSTLVVVDTTSGAQRVVATGAVTSPAWSPHGLQLAWLAPDAGGIRQVHRLSIDVDGAAPTVVTQAAHEADVRSFAWSPDGESLAYLAPTAPAAPAGDARFDRSFQALDADYLGTSYLARSPGAAPACLWIAGPREAPGHPITCRAGYIEALVWSADGRSVYINSHPGTSVVSQRFGGVDAVDVGSGALTPIVTAPANVGSDGRMSVSARGLLAYPHFRGQDPWLHQSNVAVVRDGRAVEVTSALDRHVLDFAWQAKGKSLVVEAREGVRTGLWTMGLDGTARRVALGDVNPTEDGLAASPRADTLAFIGTEPSLAPELYVLASPTSRPMRLTHFNEALGGRRLGAVTSIAWRNDGFEQAGVLTVPVDFHQGRAYPLLVNVHGGPHASSQLTFNAESQFYAAQGWLVFEPNYRGSDGWGERYRTAVVGDATAGPGRDLRAGLDAVKAQGGVDANRVALTGYSYGGVMTAWLIGHHQDWCAAIAGGVVVDFKGYYDQSDTGIWIGSLLGSPHVPANRAAYLEQSPTTYLDRATTPTLIFQDVGDDNAPIGQAYELFHALKDHGAPAVLMAFDVEGHDPDDPYRERQIASRTVAWMTEHCAPTPH